MRAAEWLSVHACSCVDGCHIILLLLSLMLMYQCDWWWGMKGGNPHPALLSLKLTYQCDWLWGMKGFLGF